MPSIKNSKAGIEIELTETLAGNPAIFIDLYGNSSSMAADTHLQAQNLADWLRRAADKVDQWSRNLK